MNEKMVWGPSPFPVGAESLGIIKHPIDGMIGVLFKLPTGILAHGAAGVIRSIGQSPAAALGSIRTPKKAAASRENGKDQRPHILKLKHFESIFPHSLISNEWQDKFQIVINGRPTTYNPDYYCPALESYIEVTTSKPNISEQGPKWRQAIENGLNLRVYWWDGTDITVQFAASRENGKKGGRQNAGGDHGVDPRPCVHRQGAGREVHRLDNRGLVGVPRHRRRGLVGEVR